MASDWRAQSAAAQGRAIGAGVLDPVDLAGAYLDAIAADPEAGRIYARLTAPRALAEAEAARNRARSDARRGLLDGVPVSWKDLFDTAGVETEAGSALLEGRVPGRDAQVLQTATAAGLVCLGKTHMTELTFSGLGVNPVTETPPNIHDAGAAPGGSSSGAAASVAFGLAAAGVGSDTGGSVRLPAAWNGLVGLKTTAGRLSLRGVVPLAARFDTVGPLCRTVEDAALMLAALEGVRAVDLRGAGLSGTRLMVLENIAFDDIQDSVCAGFEEAVERLAKAGAGIVRGTVPALDTAMALSAVLYTTEAYATWAGTIEAAPDRMYGEILKRFRVGARFSGVDYVQAWQKLAALRGDWHSATAGFDAVLLPTCPILPPQVDRLLSDGEYFASQNLLALRNTRIGNLMGGSALTLPSGTPGVGVQVLAPPRGEERLLRLGAAMERALT